MLIKQLLGNVMSGTGHICHTAQRLLTSALPSHPATRDSEARPPKCWSLSERQPPEVPPISPAPEPGLREALLSEEGNVLPRGPKAGGRKQSQGRKVATFAQSARSLPPDKAAWEVAGSPAASPVQWAAGGGGQLRTLTDQRLSPQGASGPQQTSACLSQPGFYATAKGTRRLGDMPPGRWPRPRPSGQRPCTARSLRLHVLGSPRLHQC